MTGPLKLTNGTAAAPAQSFAADPTTGVIKTTNGYGIVVGGVQVAEFTAGGLVSGSRFIGEMFFYSGRNAPPLCVFPFGQTLLRAVYPALWTFAQIEISVGNLFFNNGNGTTTFGIGNMSGRAMAARDDLSGSAANVLTASTIVPDATRTGAIGGTQLHTLIAGQIPSITSTASPSLTVAVNSANWVASSSSDSTPINVGGTGSGIAASLAGGSVSKIASSGSATGTVSSTSNNTGSGAHPNVQPTMIFNVAMFAGA
jgi:microcystin-dependent protein